MVGGVKGGGAASHGGRGKGRRGCITWWEGLREEGLHHVVGGVKGGGAASHGGRG